MMFSSVRVGQIAVAMMNAQAWTSYYSATNLRLQLITLKRQESVADSQFKAD